MDTENETKKYIQEAFNASLSEVFITDTQDHQNKNKSKMDVFIFLKKEKNIGQKCGSGKFKFCSKHKKE